MDEQSILAESRAIWDQNATAWDARMSSGGGFQSILIAPSVERMLNIQTGETVLDIACGNGIFSRAAPNWVRPSSTRTSAPN